MTEHTDDPDLATRSKCDDHIYRALSAMVDEGVTVRFSVFRMIEFNVVQSMANFGGELTLNVLKQISDAIEQGRLDHHLTDNSSKTH